MEVRQQVVERLADEFIGHLMDVIQKMGKKCQNKVEPDIYESALLSSMTTVIVDYLNNFYTREGALEFAEFFRQSVIDVYEENPDGNSDEDPAEESCQEKRVH